jgi:hypothetical protein
MLGIANGFNRWQCIITIISARLKPWAMIITGWDLSKERDDNLQSVQKRCDRLLSLSKSVKSACKT